MQNTVTLSFAYFENMLGFHYYNLSTPIGYLKLIATDHGLKSAIFADHAPEISPEVPAPLEQPVSQLKDYFAGRRRDFDLQLDLSGSAFQEFVWRHVQGIPFGRTSTYQEIANAMGDRGASRAVGSANGQNPLALIVPCHRVVGSEGQLTGYAWGLERKEWLLHFETGGVQAKLF